MVDKTEEEAEVEDFRIHSFNFNQLNHVGDILSIKQSPLLDFQKILSQSIDQLNRELLKADQMAQEMMLGQVDVHQAMIAMEQAHLTLRFLIQVRNKLIAAYEEIMRIQL